MKTTLKLIVLILSLAIVSCGGEEKKEEKVKVQLKKQTSTKKVEPAANTKASETIDLTNAFDSFVVSVSVSEELELTEPTL